MQNGIDLDLKYRPQTLDDLVGQPQAVKVIRGFGGHIPRCLLLYGPPGTGKTSTARVVARMAGVATDGWDYQEKNCGAVESPTDMVRDIARDMTAAPLSGRKMMWVLDEMQTFSKSKGAQEALLKVLEDPPPHVMFALCTTDPKRILPTIRSRCVQIELFPVAEQELETLVKQIADQERMNVSERAFHKIAIVANGSPRNAVKLLQKIAGIPGTDDQLAAIGTRIGDDVDPFGLVQAILPWDGPPNWKAAAKILQEIKEEEPEGLRMMILASAKAQLLKGKNEKGAYKMIICLADPLYDRASGHALLAAGIYQAIHGK